MEESSPDWCKTHCWEVRWGEGSRPLGERRWKMRPDWCKAGSRQQREKGLGLFV